MNYWEKIGKYILPKFVRRRIMDIESTTEEYMREIAKFIPASSRIIDLGAGECLYKDKYFNHVKYVAIDFGKGDSNYNYGHINVFCDITHVPFKDRQFDFAFCFQVLEHLREPKAVLKEINRILKDNGHLFLSTPQSLPRHQKPYDYYRYTSYGLEYLFKEAGFEVIKIEPYGGYFRLLSLNLKDFHRNIFDFRKRSLFERIVLFPLEVTSLILFRVMIPVILFEMDRIDKIRDHTYSYMCHVYKKSKKEF
jgi:SAM-dependent methyltransferase